MTSLPWQSPSQCKGRVMVPENLLRTKAPVPENLVCTEIRMLFKNKYYNAFAVDENQGKHIIVYTVDKSFEDVNLKSKKRTWYFVKRTDEGDIIVGRRLILGPDDREDGEPDQECTVFVLGKSTDSVDRCHKGRNKTLRNSCFTSHYDVFYVHDQIRTIINLKETPYKIEHADSDKEK